MSFQRIPKPYRLYLSEKAVAAGFPPEASFPNKAQTLAFIKKVQQVDPDFKTRVTTEHYRFEDTISGKRYRNRWEYAQDQQEHEGFQRREAARREAAAVAQAQQMEAFWKAYEPIFEAHQKKMAELEKQMPRRPD